MFFFIVGHKMYVLSISVIVLQLIGVATYLIAAGFFGTFTMAVDTIFLCFCKFIIYMLIIICKRRLLAFAPLLFKYSFFTLTASWETDTGVISHMQLIDTRAGIHAMHSISHAISYNGELLLRPAAVVIISLHFTLQ